MGNATATLAADRAARAEAFARLAPRLPGLVGDLRSDHAGETGAVMIYRGILAMSRDPALRRFAAAHLTTEARHLAELGALLPRRAHSRLLPLWRIAGFLTGALPALAGRHAVYATIDAVETFVDHHYEAQIRRLAPEAEARPLLDLLRECQADEVEHRDEARAAGLAPPGSGPSGREPAGPALARLMLGAWARAVGRGSTLAVAAARRV